MEIQTSNNLRSRSTGPAGPSEENPATILRKSRTYDAVWEAALPKNVILVKSQEVEENIKEISPEEGKISDSAICAESPAESLHIRSEEVSCTAEQSVVKECIQRYAKNCELELLYKFVDLNLTILQKEGSIQSIEEEFLKKKERYEWIQSEVNLGSQTICDIQQEIRENEHKIKNINRKVCNAEGLKSRMVEKMEAVPKIQKKSKNTFWQKLVPKCFRKK